MSARRHRYGGLIPPYVHLVPRVIEEVLRSGLTAAELAEALHVGVETAEQLLDPDDLVFPVAIARAVAHFSIDLSDFMFPFEIDWAYAGIKVRDLQAIRRWEAELGEIGSRYDFPLELRIAALKALPQSEMNPWIPEHHGYELILEDERYPLLTRIKVAESITSFEDPWVLLRLNLYKRAFQSAEISDEKLFGLAENLRTPYSSQDQEVARLGNELEQLKGALLGRVVREEGTVAVTDYQRVRAAYKMAGSEGILALARLAQDQDQDVRSDALEYLRKLSVDVEQEWEVRSAALQAWRVQDSAEADGNRHVFISYVRDDKEQVERLAADLKAFGLRPWLDVQRLKPGKRWRDELRLAIRHGAAFIAVFSSASESRETSYMREELIEAVSELRQRSRNRTWFLPVLLSDVPVPEMPIGAGEFLTDIQYVSLASDWDRSIVKLATAISEVLEEN